MKRRVGDDFLDGWTDTTSTDARDLSERQAGVVYPSWREAGKRTRYARRDEKPCNRCGQWKFLDEFPLRRVGGKDTISGMCGVCWRQYARKWTQQHEEHRREYIKRWREKHIEQSRAAAKRWQQENKAHLREYQRKRRQAQKEQKARAS